MMQIYTKYLNKQAFIAKNDRKMMFFIKKLGKSVVVSIFFAIFADEIPIVTIVNTELKLNREGL